MKLEQTWRWYGPNDMVSLSHIKQAGATGVVTALHHIPNGEIWSENEIRQRQKIIEEEGLVWSVVESIPVHEDIKKRTHNFQIYIDNYRQSIINLGKCGIDIVCYNFMPVLDWTRTNLDYPFEDGSTALSFDFTEFAAFELYLLKRQGSEDQYSTDQKLEARNYFNQLSETGKDRLAKNIIAGLPGAEEGYTLDQFQEVLNTYRDIDANQLKSNLYSFLEAIIPAAEKSGVLMCIHPDDPPFSILGLPRVVSTEADISALYDAVKSPNNGLTFCTGSFGVLPKNDLIGMIRRLGNRIHFVHLRATKRDDLGNFHEGNHLESDVDMFEVMKALVEEQEKRVKNGRSDIRIPFRPDHGHKMLDDLDKITNPGYSAIGRLRALAELRGLELGIRRSK